MHLCVHAVHVYLSMGCLFSGCVEGDLSGKLHDANSQRPAVVDWNKKYYDMNNKYFSSSQ